MAHRIAVCRCGSSFYAAALSAEGSPIVFQQNSDGVWLEGIDLGVPPSQGQLGNAVGPPVTSIVGVDNWFLVLNAEGSIYAIAPPENAFYDPPNQQWGQYVVVPMVSGNGISFGPYLDFAAASLGEYGIVVVAINSSYEVYIWYGIPQTNTGVYNGLPEAFNLAWLPNDAQSGGAALGQPGQDLLSVTYSDGVIAVLGISDTSIQATIEAAVPTIQIWSGTPNFANVYPYNPADFTGFTEFDSAELSPQSPDIFGPNATAGGILAAGSPNFPLQAMVLQNIPAQWFGEPYLIVDTSGDGTSWNCSGYLPSAGDFPAVPFLSTMATGVGNGGNLQLIGLHNGLPYLLWQDAETGQWAAYDNGDPMPLEASLLPVPPGGSEVTNIVDLAIGVSQAGGAPTLQAAYLQFDGNVYINWQDTQGNWYWYGGLEGEGLP